MKSALENIWTNIFVNVFAWGNRQRGSVWLCFFHVWLCITVALVTVSERSPHCSSGGCQPDPDEHWHEWTRHYSSRQEEGDPEPYQSKKPNTAYCHLVTTGNLTNSLHHCILYCLWLTQVMENEGEFLALKMVSGQYAYSMEATCPKGG